MDAQLSAGIGALTLLKKQSAKREGVGVPGPYGAIPAQVLSAGTYEISGTQVALRGSPNTGGAELARFNNAYGDNGGIVVGVPDQVEFNGETGDSGGMRWAKVKAKGQEGWVAVMYMAPVGWTAKQGKTSPVPQGGGGGGAQPVSVVDETDAPSKDYAPWILGGVAVLGLGVIGWAALSKKKKKAKRRYA